MQEMYQRKWGDLPQRNVLDRRLPFFYLVCNQIDCLECCVLTTYDCPIKSSGALQYARRACRNYIRRGECIVKVVAPPLGTSTKACLLLPSDGGSLLACTGKPCRCVRFFLSSSGYKSLNSVQSEKIKHKND